MIIKIKTILTLLVLLAAPNIVLALTCSDLDGAYVIAQDGQYLGFFGNQFASESINNTFGSYGSQFSSTSVRNQFSSYGSQFGSYSANNTFSSSPPTIYKYGEVIAYLTNNSFIGGGISLGAINCNFISSFAKTPLPQIPSSLTGLVASDGTFTDEVYLSWDSAAGATSYDVYFSLTEDGERTFINSTTFTSMSVTGTTQGTTYYFFVFPANSTGTSTGQWDTGYVASPQQLPADLTGLTASDGTLSDTVLLAWDAITSATSYEIYFSTTQEGSRTFISSTSLTNIEITGGTPGVTYYYFVFPVNSAGSGLGQWDTGYVAALQSSAPNTFSNSSFNLQSLTLDVPCVEVLSNGQKTGPNGGAQAYALTMVLVDESFQASSAVLLAESSNCTTVFESTTGRFTDQVLVDGEVYQLVLQFQSDVTFTLVSAELKDGGVSSLWRVSNGVNEVIIGGSVHVLKPTDFPLPSGFIDAYSSTEILVTEITLGDLNSIANLSNLLLTVDGSTLSSSLPLSTYQTLSSLLSSLGINIANLENTRANWVGGVLLSETLIELGFGAGVDEYLMNLAQQDGKLNWGLETAASQLNAVNRTNTHLTSNEIILNAISGVQSPHLLSGLNELINAWRSGDTSTLDSAIVETSKSASLTDYNTIFRDRNAAWIPQIEGFLATSALEFVLVGVGHLVGSESVLQMLFDLGYSVERY